MEELWKPISGFENLYEVSNLGRVKALERLVWNNGGLQHKHERILKQNDNRSYKMVVLCKDGKTFPRLVHRLVATEFVPNPESKPIVDHIDTDPSNNSADNLRWATTQENCLNPLTRLHGSIAKIGHPFWGREFTPEERRKIADKNRGRKLTDEQRKKLSDAHKNNPKALAAALRNIELARQAKLKRHREKRALNRKENDYVPVTE